MYIYTVYINACSLPGSPRAPESGDDTSTAARPKLGQAQDCSDQQLHGNTLSLRQLP